MSHSCKLCLLFITEKFTVNRMSDIDLWFDSLHFKCNFEPFIEAAFYLKLREGLTSSKYQ